MFCIGHNELIIGGGLLLGPALAGLLLIRHRRGWALLVAVIAALPVTASSPEITYLVWDLLFPLAILTAIFSRLFGKWFHEKALMAVGVSGLVVVILLNAGAAIRGGCLLYDGIRVVAQGHVSQRLREIHVPQVAYQMDLTKRPLDEAKMRRALAAWNFPGPTDEDMTALDGVIRRRLDAEFHEIAERLVEEISVGTRNSYIAAIDAQATTWSSYIEHPDFTFDVLRERLQNEVEACLGLGTVAPQGASHD